MFFSVFLQNGSKNANDHIGGGGGGVGEQTLSALDKYYNNVLLCFCDYSAI